MSLKSLKVQLFDNVYIPQAVYEETLLSGKEDISSKIIAEAISSGSIVLFNVKNEIAIKALSGRLHSGEVYERIEFNV